MAGNGWTSVPIRVYNLAVCGPDSEAGRTLPSVFLTEAPSSIFHREVGHG
jgi:hypothetical protein